MIMEEIILAEHSNLNPFLIIVYICILKMRVRDISGSAEEDEPTQPIHNHALEDLQSQVSLTSLQLLDLISNDQKFTHRILSYNQAGVQYITTEDYERGLVYLQETEKILEYAASCGKTIDRFLITCTLHNEACVYQKLWELEKSCDYMEAIIFNMSTYLDQATTIEITPELNNPHSDSYQILSAYVTRRLSTAIYHLQYSAVSSQVGKHEVAIESSKQCLELLTQILTEESAYENFRCGTRSAESKLKLLKKRSQGVHKDLIPTLITECRNQLQSLRVHQENLSEDLKKMKKFSIGQVMQINPTTSERANEVIPIDTLLKKVNFYYLVFYTSIAYYAIATEMRLINNTETSQVVKKEEMQKSKIYHLYSIKILLEFVPFLSDYLEHIVKSLKNNFHIDLNAETFGVEDVKLDPFLIMGSPFYVDWDQESQQEREEENSDSDNFHEDKTQIKRCITEGVAENQLPCKKNSEFLTSQEREKSKKKKIKSKLHKVHSISISSKLREKHTFSKDLISAKAKRPESKYQEDEETKKKHTAKGQNVKQMTSKREKEKQKMKTGNSYEKTKDQTKKNDDKQKRTKVSRKLADDYTGNKQKSKDMKRKEREKKSVSRKKINTIKSVSGGKQNFLSPRGHVNGKVFMRAKNN